MMRILSVVFLVLCIFVFNALLYIFKAELLFIPFSIQIAVSFCLGLCAVYCLLRKRGCRSLCSCLLALSVLLGGLCLPYIVKFAGKSKYFLCLTAPECCVHNIHTTVPCVALTFDDGPDAGNTATIVRMLAEHDAHATFFIQGSHVAGNEAIIKEMIENGHEVANHSWSHPNLSITHDDDILREIRQCNDALTLLTGKEVQYVRPPFGALTCMQARKIYQQFGSILVLWNLNPEIKSDARAKEVCAKLEQEISPGSIILLHDRMTAPQHVESIVELLQKKGYRITTVSELLESTRQH